MNSAPKGKLALVTGSSGGIGAAIVRRLAAEGAPVYSSNTSSPEVRNALGLFPSSSL